MTMLVLFLALMIGFTVGLRAVTPLAILSIAARTGWLPLDGTVPAFMCWAITPSILAIFALGELVNDKLPKTPSRMMPMQFGTRTPQLLDTDGTIQRISCDRLEADCCIYDYAIYSSLTVSPGFFPKSGARVSRSNGRRQRTPPALARSMRVLYRSRHRATTTTLPQF